MKKNYILAVAVGLLFASQAFAGLTVTLSQDAYSSGSGGEFNAVTTGGSFLADYAASTSTGVGAGTGFETFCIDASHYWYSGVTYSATLGSTTYAGSGNQISLGTCYLYSQFAAGTLSGYNYSTFGTARKTSAGLLQNTLWALEGEISSAGIFVTGNAFYNDLISTFGTIANAEGNAGTNNFGVAVLQLSCSGVIGQSQLVETVPPSQSHSQTPIPEPSTVIAGVLLLLPFGVSTLRILRRNKGQTAAD